jgi:hypothetical protein
MFGNTFNTRTMSRRQCAMFLAWQSCTKLLNNALSPPFGVQQQQQPPQKPSLLVYTVPLLSDNTVSTRTMLRRQCAGFSVWQSCPKLLKTSQHVFSPSVRVHGNNTSNHHDNPHFACTQSQHCLVTALNTLAMLHR